MVLFKTDSSFFFAVKSSAFSIVSFTYWPVYSRMQGLANNVTLKYRINAEMVLFMKVYS